MFMIIINFQKYHIFFCKKQRFFFNTFLEVYLMLMAPFNFVIQSKHKIDFTRSSKELKYFSLECKSLRDNKYIITKFIHFLYFPIVVPWPQVRTQKDAQIIDPDLAPPHKSKYLLTTSTGLWVQSGSNKPMSLLTKACCLLLVLYWATLYAW